MKLDIKPKAIDLRKRGYSIGDIAKTLHISESTASLWCRSIFLTDKQKASMERRTEKKLSKFFKLVEKQKQVRAKTRGKIVGAAAKEIGTLSKRDLLIAGSALYWAEGFKHAAESRVGLCNSDPAMVKFMIVFLMKHFGITIGDISPRLTINESFKDREENITRYWSEYLGIPQAQFTKPFYQKVKLIKVYEHPENYHGVLRIHVKKSSQLLLKMRGYMEGLKRFGML